MPLNGVAGEDSWMSLGWQGDQTSQCKARSTLNIHCKDWCWSWSSVFWSSDANRRLIGKIPDAVTDRGQKEKSVSEDEMAGRHPWCNEHELRQTPGDGEGQGGLVCCSPWGHKESDTTECLNNNTSVRHYTLC